MRLLLLGGTREARLLAERLAERSEIETIYALAGLTEGGAPDGVALCRGGFGGANGLAAFLAQQQIDRLIDATHPFAAQISANAVRAAHAADVAHIRLERPAWIPTPDDDWRVASDLASAVQAPPSGARVFLALGRRGAEMFVSRCDLWRAARAAEAGDPIPGVDHLEIGPPGHAAEEAALFQRLHIDWIVARNSGGTKGYGKIEAARRLGLPVIMAARPSLPGRAISGVEEALTWLCSRAVW